VRTAPGLAEPASEVMSKKASPRKISAVLKLPTLLLTRSWPRRYAMSNCNVETRCQTAMSDCSGIRCGHVVARGGREPQGGRGAPACAAYACCLVQRRTLCAAGCTCPTVRHRARVATADRVLRRNRHACWITAPGRRAVRHQSKGRASTEMSGLSESGFHARSSGSIKLAMMGRNSRTVMTCSFAMTTCSAAAVASGTLGPTQGVLRCACALASPCPGTYTDRIMIVLQELNTATMDHD
jgi:hypothetical protein